MLPPLRRVLIAFRALDDGLGQSESRGRGVDTQGAGLEKTPLQKRQNELNSFGEDVEHRKRAAREGPI